MLTIRFSRVGKKKQPSYRIIISEKTKDPWGDYLELLGNYNPRTKQANLKVERIKYWLSKGAQTSNTIHNLLVKQGVVEDKKKRKVIKLTKKRQEKIKAKKGEAEPATPAEAKPAEPTEAPANKE